MMTRRISEASADKHRKFIEVTDMRTLLRLGLALGNRRTGTPLERLNRAMKKLARLVKADAWTAGTVFSRHVSVVVSSENSSAVVPSKKLLATAARKPGRVVALMERDSIASARYPDEGTNDSGTWMSVLRRSPFTERERRLVELCHSQFADAISSPSLTRKADGS